MGGQDPVSGAGREPHPAGRQDPTGRDPHPRVHANHTVSGKAQSYDGRQDPVSGASRDLTPAGRDPHPRGRQPGHQGEWASIKETSRTQRLQPVHQGCKEIAKSKTVITA